MKITISILLLLFSFIRGIAQDDYTEGYYITYGSDSVFTKIKVINSPAAKKIGYINKKGKKKKFSASEVTEYGLNDLSSYAAIAPLPKAPKVRFFAEIVVDGQARLLYYSFKKNYFIKRRGSTEAVKIKKGTFRKQMMRFFQDFDDLRRAVKKKEIKYEQLETAVAKYNSWYEEFYRPYQKSLKRKR